MAKIVFLFGVWFGIILCKMRLEAITGQVLSCKNPPLCYLSDLYKKDSDMSLLSYPNIQNYAEQKSNLQRSYYNHGFGSSVSPAYPTFDPISVLASLAFLAFLLQSFASLFDRSRTILPTIVSGRQSVDLTIPEISKHVSHALREYGNLGEDLDANK